MELYLLIASFVAFATGLCIGICTFYAGFRLGFKVHDRISNNLPLDEENDDFDQDMTS